MMRGEADEEIDELGRLPRLEPGPEIDARVRAAWSGRIGAAPFWPFERALYAVVVAAYAVYVAAETIEAFQCFGS